MVSHYASICALSITGAALAAIAYLHVHAEITTLEQAQGYVDPLLRAGIVLGFVVMVAIVAALLWVAVWSAVRAVRAWRSEGDR
jgi:hypothetical protein